jgi:dTDP-4-dehydrorhamnose 3,5-epimerase
MKVIDAALDGLMLLEPRVFPDDRGFFLESWNAATFRTLGIEAAFVQDNHSGSVRGTLRGLHYQSAVPQGKLVRVLAGEILDVAVDIRPGSPTFGQWRAWRLDAVRHRMLWVPRGFAHGFLALAEWVEVAYKCDAPYHRDSEVSIRWDDPEIGIDWGLAEVGTPRLSPKDAAGVTLREAPIVQLG